MGGWKEERKDEINIINLKERKRRVQPADKYTKKIAKLREPRNVEFKEALKLTKNQNEVLRVNDDLKTQKNPRTQTTPRTPKTPPTQTTPTTPTNSENSDKLRQLQKQKYNGFKQKTIRK